MPDIDANLARLVGMVAAALVVILLLAVLSAVGKLRKSIDGVREDLNRASAPPAAVRAGETRPEGETSGSSPGPGVVAAAPEEHGPAPVQEAPVQEAPVQEAPVQEAPVQEAPAPVQEAPAPVEQGQVQEAPAPVEEAPAPVERASATVQETFAPAQAEQPAAVAADPQEQPFERDGRWWFKRGDELLVYDEQSGQWTPAPAAAVATQDIPRTSFTELTNSKGDPGPSKEVAEAGFWKCTSCGAVNGTTATTCRMCFAARP